MPIITIPASTSAAFRCGVREPGAQLLGELVENPAAQPVRKDIHFQVEHPEFRLEIPAGDALEHLGIQHPRHAVRPREIQLDLQAHEIPGPVEPLAPPGASPAPSRHCGELLAVRAADRTGRTRLPRPSPPSKGPSSSGRPAARPLVSRSMMPRRGDPITPTHGRRHRSSAGRPKPDGTFRGMRHMQFARSPCAMVRNTDGYQPTAARESTWQARRRRQPESSRNCRNSKARISPCAQCTGQLAETPCEHVSYKLRERGRELTHRLGPPRHRPSSGPATPTAPSAPAHAPPCLRSERRPTMPLHVPPAPAPALRSVLAALGSPPPSARPTRPLCGPSRDH